MKTELLLKFILANQVAFMQSVERIEKFLEEEFPEKKEVLIKWRHKDEVFQKLRVEFDEMEMNIDEYLQSQ